MPPTYKEARFPTDYREAEVRQIMDAVYRLRSISITGLAGMGKSNVVRFIVSHPQVGPRYLKERAKDTALVHVDCAGLAEGDEAELLTEVVAQMNREGLTTDDAGMPHAPSGIRRALREQILGVEPSLALVLVLDYFDQAAAALGRPFFNYLFHLRNVRPRANLSYVFATRRPLPPLYELQDLMDDGCAIGPLSHKDALESVQRDEARLGCTFGPGQRESLIACTGGHPGFLKNAAELLGSGKVGSAPSEWRLGRDDGAPSEWRLCRSGGAPSESRPYTDDGGLPDREMARQLLRSGKVKNLCDDLWGDLTAAEQAVVLKAATGAPLLRSADAERVAALERCGILVTGGGAPMGASGVRVFCPLFEVYVDECQSPGVGTVRITAVFPNRARVETAMGEQSVTLSPKLFALLLALTAGRGQAIPADDIILQVYGDEAAGVTNAALSQLVKRLRGRLDPCVRRMTGDDTYTCVETVRDVGYRFK